MPNKKVKLEDIFELVHDDADNTFYQLVHDDADNTFYLKVKPEFADKAINIHTDYGKILIDHWSKNEEVIEVKSIAFVDGHPKLNEICLEGFDRKPPERFGTAYITIKRKPAKVPKK